jgi:hypothetical protein
LKQNKKIIREFKKTYMCNFEGCGQCYQTTMKGRQPNLSAIDGKKQSDIWKILIDVQAGKYPDVSHGDFGVPPLFSSRECAFCCCVS